MNTCCWFKEFNVNVLLFAFSLMISQLSSCQHACRRHVKSLDPIPKQPVVSRLNVEWGIAHPVLSSTSSLISGHVWWVVGARGKASWDLLGVFVWWGISCSVPVIAFQSCWVSRCQKMVFLEGTYWSRVFTKSKWGMNETCGFYLRMSSIQEENTIFDFSCLRKTWFKNYFYDFGSWGMGETGSMWTTFTDPGTLHQDSEDVSEMSILLKKMFTWNLP